MKFLARRHLALRTQVALAMVGLLILAIAAISVSAYNTLSSKIDADLAVRTNWSLRVASRVMAEALSVFQVEMDASQEPQKLRLHLGEDFLRSLSSHELTKIVDSISEANRGTATIFFWDEAKKDFVRMATTVKKADGTRAVGTVLGQQGVVYPYMMRLEAYRGVAQILGESYMTGYIPIVTGKDKPIGILFVGVGKMAELVTAKNEFLFEAAKMGLIIAGVVGLLIFAMVSRAFRPLREVEGATARLAAGEVGTEVPHSGRTDDVGNIARAVESFRDAVRAQNEAEAARLAEVERIAARKAEMESMVASFRASIDLELVNLRAGNETVVSAVGQIRDAISLAAERASEGRRAVVSGEAAVADVAVATNQYAGSIQEISQRANEASTVVRKAAETGHKASTVVGELSDVVDKITNAVGFISSIAAQTNLLALNATIEAARAGEAGRGFAVVAAEVKELSNGTAKAAAEIVDLVRGIQSVTTAVTSATSDIGSDLESINQTTMAIAAAVAEQEQVTQGIAGNASLAANGTGVIREGFEAIESVIQETSRAADSLDEVSTTVARTTESLIGGIEDFLKTMAA